MTTLGQNTRSQGSPIKKSGFKGRSIFRVALLVCMSVGLTGCMDLFFLAIMSLDAGVPRDQIPPKFLPPPPPEPTPPPLAPPVLRPIDEMIQLNFTASGAGFGYPDGTLFVVLTWDSPRDLKEFHLMRRPARGATFFLENETVTLAPAGSPTDFLVLQTEINTGGLPTGYYVVSKDSATTVVDGVERVVKEISNVVEVSTADIPAPMRSPKGMAGTEDGTKAMAPKRKSSFSRFSGKYRLKGKVNLGGETVTMKFRPTSLRQARSADSSSLVLTGIGTRTTFELTMDSNGEASGQFELPFGNTTLEMPFTGSHQRRGSGVFSEISGEIGGETLTGRISMTPKKNRVSVKVELMGPSSSISFDLKGSARRR